MNTTKSVPTFSRNIIIDAIRKSSPEASFQELADSILKALAAKHLHIFKSEGSER
jgi:hypothetical protein